MPREQETRTGARKNLERGSFTKDEYIFLGYITKSRRAFLVPDVEGQYELPYFDGRFKVVEESRLNPRKPVGRGDEENNAQLEEIFASLIARQANQRLPKSPTPKFFSMFDDDVDMKVVMKKRPRRARVKQPYSHLPVPRTT